MQNACWDGTTEFDRGLCCSEDEGMVCDDELLHEVDERLEVSVLAGAVGHRSRRRLERVTLEKRKNLRLKLTRWLLSRAEDRSRRTTGRRYAGTFNGGGGSRTLRSNSAAR